MSNLISVPYQPGYKATPATVARLQTACNIAGHNIPIDDAWRSYVEQSYYWDQYINHDGNPASNPDTGQRNHMRGAAFDIVNRSDRNAMLQAGFTPDSDEWWHFNDPNWQNMPIILTDDSNNNTNEENDMPLTDADVYKIWTFDLQNQSGQTINGKPPVHGRAADWLTNMSDAVGATKSMVAAIQANPTSVIDPTKLASALIAAGVEVKVDTAAIAKAIDASLADDFKALPTATVAALGQQINQK